MTTSSLKRHLRTVRQGRPGERFENYYQRSKRDRKSGAGVSRVVRFILALVLFAIGVVFVFIPGPAILFFFLGGGLLASESLVVARTMDWLEVRGRAVWRWSQERWSSLPLSGKIALVATALIAGSAVLYGSWLLLRR